VILREILKWIKFAGAKEVKSTLLAALDNEQKRLIYHLSNGNRGSLEIAKAAGTSDTTVRRYWEAWARQGIVEALKVRGGERYKKSFDLEDFGIEAPEPKITVQPGEAKPVTSAESEEIK
jgi:hypothetical protein